MIILLHRDFKKKFTKLHPKLKKQFWERRDLFLQNPFHPLLNNHALSGNRQAQWSINITGDWRLIYEFTDTDTVVFLDIDTHNNLYGK